MDVPDHQKRSVRSHERMQALGQVMAVLANSRSLRTTVATLLGVAKDLIQTPAAALYLLSKEGDQLLLYSSFGVLLGDSAPRAFDLVDSAARRVIDSGLPQELAATTPHVRLPHFSDGSLPQSGYAVPITSYNGPCGTLEVYSRTASPLDPDERALLVALAASAGIAISNSQLLDEHVQARQAAEEQARVAAEQATQLHAIIGAMTDGVWVCNQTGIITSVNDAGLRMFGLRRADIVGQPIAKLAEVLEVGRGERRRLGLRLALQGELAHLECEMSQRPKGDHLTVDIRSTPLRDENGVVTGAIAVVRDMTTSKTMDRLREDFLSVAAHELKTPITALKGYTQLALKRTPPSTEMHATRRTLTTIDEQADRITKLVQKLLDVSRIRSGQLELELSSFDMQDLVAGVVNRVSPTAQAYQINIEPHPALIITADHERIEQVLLHLVENAIKYSAKGNTIVIVSKVVGSEAHISVNDHGVGIPDEKLPHIFERWYQAHFSTHGDYGGMGLGLYICKEIVEQHGGRMWAKSSDTEGTTIGFALPLHPAN